MPERQTQTGDAVPFKTPPFKEVILAGTPDYLNAYFGLLNQLGVKVSGIITKNAVPEYSAPVMTVARYAKSPSLHKLPVLVLDYADNSTRSFFFDFVIEFLTYIDPDTKSIPGFLHCAYIGNFYSNINSGLWGNCGYPGSGNMTLYYLLRNIRDPATITSENIVQNLLKCTSGAFSLSYHVALALMFDDVLPPELYSYRYLTPNSRCFRGIFSKEDFFMVTNLPSTSFIRECYQSHDLWKPSTRELFEQLGYDHLFFATRNPVNIIVSNAAKSCRPPEVLLYDDDWFTKASKEIATMLRLALNNKDMFNFIRYEDIISEPVSRIKKIAGLLNVEMTDEKAEEIWGKVGFKNLNPTAKGHMFKPGKDKIDYFNKHMLEIMEQDGHREIAEELGYEWPDIDSLPVDPPRQGDYGEVQRSYTRVIASDCHRWVDEELKMSVLASKKETLRRLRQNISKSVPLRLFLKSLGNSYCRIIHPDEYELV